MSRSTFGCESHCRTSVVTPVSLHTEERVYTAPPCPVGKLSWAQMLLHDYDAKLPYVTFCEGHQTLDGQLLFLGLDTVTKGWNPRKFVDLCQTHIILIVNIHSPLSLTRVTDTSLKPTKPTPPPQKCWSLPFLTVLYIYIFFFEGSSIGHTG